MSVLSRFSLLAGILVLASVGAAAQPAQITIAGHVLSDNGDDDGFADTNETVTMRLVVRNTGSQDLTGVIARMTTEDPTRVCVTAPQIVIGDLDGGEQRLTLGAFTFKIADDVERSDAFEELVSHFSITFSSDQSGAPSEPEPLVLDLDLDAAGGSGASAFFEGFEVLDGLGSFTTANLDFGFLTGDPHANSDGYRCQYNDPAWSNSNSYGVITDCYLGPTPAATDAYNWQVDGPEALDGGRSFSGMRSLYMGIVLDEQLGRTTPMAALEATHTIDPVNLNWGRVCSSSRDSRCAIDADCPASESCVDVNPTLSFKQQISLIDSRTVNVTPGESADRGVVHAQLADSAGDPVGHWIKLTPYVNRYDQQGTDNYTNCTFDPIDDGNDEDSYFDPFDPWRRYGPSSTCFPAYTFVYLGDTDESFDFANIGNADGPGLEGETGLGTWVESSFDLSRFRGRRLRLRFLNTSLRAGTYETYEQIFQYNPDPGDDGWWIDDVTLSDTLSAPATVGVDTADNSGLPGGLPDTDLDGTFDPCDNCPDDANADQDDTDGDLDGDVCDACPYEFIDDADGDGLCCPEDNCCADYNPDQQDSDGDGVGDPCDVNPVFTVSNDPADEPDFATIEDAVAAVFQSGTRIRILPGLEPYYQYVDVDSPMLLHFEGIGAPGAVQVSGGIDVMAIAGTARTTIRNITFSEYGIRAAVPVDVENCTFDALPVSGVDLLAGDHVLRGLKAAETDMARAVWVREGASAVISDSTFISLTGNGVQVGGTAEVRNSLIADCFDGVSVGATGSVHIAHSTLSDNGVGVDHSGLGVTLEYSIVHGNTQDVQGVDCSSVSWSALGDLDCSETSNNASVDPAFIAGYRLDKTSPLIDYGPSPELYDGTPRRDLDGGPRLRDHDGDGLAQIDLGAYEMNNGTLLPREVTGLVWNTKSNAVWTAEPTAVEYHVYRGLLAELSYSHFADCRDTLDADRTDTALFDDQIPGPFEANVYVITAEDAQGRESTLGVGTSAERSNFAPCP
ncbi:MAG: right-handed parallel beta-helix repeat-containing protein [bacterium]|nr:right-handed parallel beta-helix repeat-containing protein [bacterium]